MPLTSGTRLGPYQIESAIGAGGMGEVYRARDTRLNRIVAIKKLTGPHNARFEQEARAIAALNHPHICTLYDVGPDYLVMEYVEGSPLRGPVGADEAMRLAGQIASALEAAHQKGILHRDLKPGNVLVSGGSVKLLDFGLAKLTADAETPDVTRTVEGTVLGTVGYMSPEQAQGKPLDERSDVFSLGAVLYELLSGDRAFPGTSSAGILSSVLRDEPSPLAVHDALARIVTRCLRKAPADRFQSMAELKAAIEEASAAPADRRPSIAVLPFADMSPGKDNEYFSDGLAEEIINALAQIRGLKVIARTSAFAFKGQNIDIRQIARTLGVASVVEGSVRKAGSRIRVTAQLISATDGSHLWSERYDRELTDVFAVQDEIATAIAHTLEARFSAGAAPGRQYTPTLQAYEEFLKARYNQWKVAPESMARSREHLERAIALDPEFALAHSALSLHYLWLTIVFQMPARDAMPRVRASAQRALDLDASLPEAHAMLGVVAALYEYDWNDATRRFALAMAREPVSPEVRSIFGLFFLLYSGRAAEAVDEFAAALTEDPLSVMRRYQLGVSLLAAGRDGEATAELTRTAELDPSFMLPVGVLAMRHASQGNLQEGLAYAERTYRLGPWDPVATGLYAGMLVRTGDASRAKELLGTLGDGTAFGAPMGFVVFHLVCGEDDLAADWAGKAIDQRYPAILFFLNLPFGKALRGSPRWPALAKRMHLPKTPEPMRDR